MLDLKKISEEERAETAFQLVVAMRDTINIAKKTGNKSTYENAIQLFYDFSPELYNDIVDSLPQRNLSDEAKVYIASAKVESESSGKQVSPLTLLEEDIEKYKTIIKKSDKDDKEGKKVLRNKLVSLESLRKSLKPREISENRILIRDTTKASREDFGARFLSDNDFHVDYEISSDRYLRIRLLHPDVPEHLTGADLIYEQHDTERGKIRILFLQYKIWEDGVLYFSQVRNLESQLEKLERCLCSNGRCDGPVMEEKTREFRFPYCAAFFRPTDKLQRQNEKLVSSGLHIPVCTIRRLMQEGNKKLERRSMRKETLNHENV